MANCACCCLYRRSVIEKIGGFDEYFWSDWEDHDLGLRINLAGFKNIYIPDTTVLHVGGGTVKRSQTSAARCIRIIRNTMFTYVKNYEAQNLILPLIYFSLSSVINQLILNIALNEYRIFKGLFKKNREESDMFIEHRRTYPALFRAYFEFFRDFKKVLTQREEIQKMRRSPDRYIFSITREPN